jgi:hypothetical protein
VLFTQKNAVTPLLQIVHEKNSYFRETGSGRKVNTKSFDQKSEDPETRQFGGVIARTKS